jgi:hypothetical protein
VSVSTALSLLRAVRVNCLQIQRYIQVYNRRGGVSDDGDDGGNDGSTTSVFDERRLQQLLGRDFTRLEDGFRRAEAMVQEVTGAEQQHQQQQQEEQEQELSRRLLLLSHRYQQHIHSLSDMCREQWTTFNLTLMHSGLAVLAATAALLLLLLLLLTRAQGSSRSSSSHESSSSNSGTDKCVMALLLVVYCHGLFSNAFIQLEVSHYHVSA